MVSPLPLLSQSEHRSFLPHTGLLRPGVRGREIIISAPRPRHSPMPNMPSNFCQREEIGGKFAITPISLYELFCKLASLQTAIFWKEPDFVMSCLGCDNCPGLTQADADKSAKQQLLPPRQYKAIQWKSSRRNTMCGVTLSAIGWNTIMAAQAPFIIDCTVVGPAGPANCSFL